MMEIKVRLGVLATLLLVTYNIGVALPGTRPLDGRGAVHTDCAPHSEPSERTITRTSTDPDVLEQWGG